MNDNLERQKIREEIKTNLEEQLKEVDEKVDKATKKVESLMFKRNAIATLMEKFNRL